MPPLVTLTRALLIALNCSVGLAFYLPGVSQAWDSRPDIQLGQISHTLYKFQTAPQDYKEGDRIDVQVNSLSPMLTSNIVSPHSAVLSDRASANNLMSSLNSLEITH